MIATLVFISTVLWCALCFAVKGGQHRPVKIWVLKLAGAQVTAKGDLVEGAEAKTIHRVLHRLLDGKIVSTLLFSPLVLALVLITCKPLWIVEAVGMNFGVPGALFTLVLAAAGWLCAVTPSVGEELGGTGGYKGKWGQYVDARRPDGRPAFGAGYGWQKCLQRGTWHGVFISFIIGNVAAIPFGALMPYCAWLGISIEQDRSHTSPASPQVSWWRFEWIFGGLGTGLPLALFFLW